jgi:DNA-binding MarR family transcriptional regulator
MTRWLDLDEQRAWRAYLTAGRLVQEAVDAQLQRDAGMPHTYYEILVRLSEAPGRCLRMTRLAAASTSSPSRISHAVTRLEERGWVRRRADEGDRRGQVAELTDAGFEALAAAAPGHVEAVRRAVFDSLTPAQVRAFGEACERIVAGLTGADELAPGDVAR